jgi:hypothetical protein
VILGTKTGELVEIDPSNWTLVNRTSCPLKNGSAVRRLSVNKQGLCIGFMDGFSHFVVTLDDGKLIRRHEQPATTPVC